MPKTGITDPAAVGGATDSTSTCQTSGGGATCQGFGDLFDSSAIGRTLAMNSDMETEAIPGQNKRLRDDDHGADEFRTPLRPAPSGDTYTVKDTTQYVNKIAELESMGIILTREQRNTLMQNSGYVKLITLNPNVTNNQTSENWSSPPPAGGRSKATPRNRQSTRQGANKQSLTPAGATADPGGTGGIIPQQKTTSLAPQRKPQLPRWSFKVATESNVDELRLLEAIGASLPDGCTIRSRRVAPSGKLMFVKTSLVHGDPAGSFNHLIQPRVKTRVEAMYNKGSLVFSHFDPSAKTEGEARLTKQAILRGVPLSAEPAWLMEKIKEKGGEYATKIETVVRITSRETKQKTGLVRVFCTDTIMAKRLVTEGLSLSGLHFRCEEPNNKPTPMQCFNCQGFHHMSYTCQEPQKCGKCGGCHRTKDCSVKESLNFLCPSCKGNHGAWFSGCPTRIAAQQKMLAETAAKKAQAPGAQPATVSEVGKVRQVAAQTQAAVTKQGEMSSQKMGELKQYLEGELAKMRRDISSELQSFKTEMTNTIVTTIQESFSNSTVTCPNSQVSPAKQFDQKALQASMKKQQKDLQQEFRKCMEAEIAHMKDVVTAQLETTSRRIGNDNSTLLTHVNENTEKWRKTVSEKEIEWTSLIEDIKIQSENMSLQTENMTKQVANIMPLVEQRAIDSSRECVFEHFNEAKERKQAKLNLPNLDYNFQPPREDCQRTGRRQFKDRSAPSSRTSSAHSARTDQPYFIPPKPGAMIKSSTRSTLDNKPPYE